MAASPNAVAVQDDELTLTFAEACAIYLRFYFYL
jgi:hypothetical protein